MTVYCAECRRAVRSCACGATATPAPPERTTDPMDTITRTFTASLVRNVQLHLMTEAHDELTGDTRPGVGTMPRRRHLPPCAGRRGGRMVSPGFSATVVGTMPAEYGQGRAHAATALGKLGVELLAAQLLDLDPDELCQRCARPLLAEAAQRIADGTLSSREHLDLTPDS